jgi:hypothetical protein
MVTVSSLQPAGQADAAWKILARLHSRRLYLGFFGFDGHSVMVKRHLVDKSLKQDVV